MRWQPGDSRSLERHIDEATVNAFAAFSGDNNPLHLDPEFAKGTRFGQRIAHGMILGAMLSNVLGMQIPGTGAIYISQTFTFRRPVFLGDTVKLVVAVQEIAAEKPVMTLSTVWTKQDGTVVADGQAKLLYPDLERS